MIGVNDEYYLIESGSVDHGTDVQGYDIYDYHGRMFLRKTWTNLWEDYIKRPVISNNVLLDRNMNDIIPKDKKITCTFLKGKSMEFLFQGYEEGGFISVNSEWESDCKIDQKNVLFISFLQNIQ